MKKNTFLSLILIAFLGLTGFAQGHETFDNVNLSGTSYGSGTFQGQDGSTWTYVRARGDFEITGQAITLGRIGKDDPEAYVESGTIANGIGTLKFSYMQAFGTNVNLKVYVNETLVHTATTDNQKEEVFTTDNIEVNIGGDVVIKFDNPDGGQVTIDDVIWTAMGDAPTLTITSPTDGAELSPLETPTIEFNVANFDISTSATAGDGDGYIQYQVGQDAFEDHFSTDAIVLTDLDAGEHAVTLQLVDNNGDVLTPEVNSAVTFTVNEITEVNNIDALRTSDLGGYYTLTEEVVLTYQQNFRGQKYIQDATGAILIDDNDGVLTKAYNQYDGITGISGKLQEHNGLKQFVPIIDADDATSTDNSVDIVVLSISDYMANPTDYESQIIAFENVHFTDADGTETFATGTNYDISDGSNSSIMRTNFYDADYIGEIIPEGTLPAISGIAAHFNGDGQIFPRDMNDLDGTTLSIKEFETATSIDIYPNPATDRFYVNVNSNAQVEVFSIIGKKVVHTQVADQNTPVSIQNLKSGVYIIKVTQDGATTTKKLIIK